MAVSEKTKKCSTGWRLQIKHTIESASSTEPCGRRKEGGVRCAQGHSNIVQYSCRYEVAQQGICNCRQFVCVGGRIPIGGSVGSFVRRSMGRSVGRSVASVISKRAPTFWRCVDYCTKSHSVEMVREALRRLASCDTTHNSKTHAKAPPTTPNAKNNSGTNSTNSNYTTHKQHRQQQQHQPK